jgi:hypothetical protein
MFYCSKVFELPEYVRKTPAAPVTVRRTEIQRIVLSTLSVPLP